MTLPRHGEEGANNAHAPVGRVTNAPRPLGDDRVLCRFLEQRNLPKDGRYRIIEFVSHAREKGPEHRHLLALIERLALADQRLLGLPALRNIRQRADQTNWAVFRIDNEPANAHPARSALSTL